ncbi:MAG TPA: hypothetical protein ENH41_03840 [Candidatus Omnitrophica bacterium]|nr:hypothetical protein [Candidatus Omnitrophota bacterium]
MNMNDSWEKALQNTKLIRPRVQELFTFTSTPLPYLFLSESSVNRGDTVVRQGEVVVERPALILPSNLPQFEGFDSQDQSGFNESSLTNFLFIRGVKFPSLKYNNKTQKLDVFEGALDTAVSFHLNRLEREENVSTGLVSGPEDCWQLSVLIFVCSQIARSAEGDMKRIVERLLSRDKLN